MFNEQLQAMKAMEVHREDEMLAGFGALRVVRDEEEHNLSHNWYVFLSPAAFGYIRPIATLN